MSHYWLVAIALNIFEHWCFGPAEFEVGSFAPETGGVPAHPVLGLTADTPEIRGEKWTYLPQNTQIDMMKVRTGNEYAQVNQKRDMYINAYVLHKCAGSFLNATNINMQMHATCDNMVM